MFLATGIKICEGFRWCYFVTVSSEAQFVAGSPGIGACWYNVHLKLTRNLRDGQEDGERPLSQPRRGIVDLFDCNACRLD